MTVCPFAAWKPVRNHGGNMSRNIGLILHVQEGNNGLSGWFNNPASGASSTWWVGKNGALEQYVICEQKAWAQGAGNDSYNSVETEGRVAEPLTAAQEAKLAQLYAWGAKTFGWAWQTAEAAGQPGFGWHGMGGIGWGGHLGCPGDVRRPRRQPILDQARGIVPIPPQPVEKGAMDITRTPSGQGYYIVGSDGGVFTFGDAKFHGSLGATKLTAPIVDIAVRPQDDGYWLVGSDGGVFTFGAAPFQGSMGGKPLAAPVKGIDCTGDGQGYWLLGEDGGVFSFNAPFYGAATGDVK